MIRSKDFIKRKIGTQYVIVAVGAATKRFNGMISVNGTGSFLWDLLAEETTLEELVQKVTDTYEVDADTARADAEAFLATLKEAGALAE